MSLQMQFPWLYLASSLSSLCSRMRCKPSYKSYGYTAHATESWYLGMKDIISRTSPDSAKIMSAAPITHNASLWPCFITLIQLYGERISHWPKLQVYWYLVWYHQDLFWRGYPPSPFHASTNPGSWRHSPQKLEYQQYCLVFLVSTATFGANAATLFFV